MNSSYKALAAFVGAVVIGAAIYGAYQYPKLDLAVSSSAGTTFSNAKVAEIIMSPTSASATSSSLYNADASDRIIDSGFVSCNPAVGSVYAQTAAGVAAWTWIAATTSTAAPAVITTNAASYALNVNVSTSTTNDSYIATSTYTNVIARRWASGTYLTFQPNATSSTSGLNCQVGVYYHGS